MSPKIIITALGALLATPAAATAPAPQSTPAKQSRPTAEKADATKYCLTFENTTGSRIERSECRTKENWAKDGIDVDHLDT